MEPLVDAAGVLGADGLTGGCTPRMSEALRQTRTGRRTSARLPSNCIASTASPATMAAVVPLWQLTDPSLTGASLEGFRTADVDLYQDIERWKSRI